VSRAEALTLRRLEVEDEVAFRAAILEFRSVDPDFYFAFQFDDGADFAQYVRKVQAWSRGEELPSTFVPNTYLIAVVGADIVGRLSIRHQLNDFLTRVGGHIGYGVVPRHRRKGYGRAMLGQGLGFARAIGLDRVLVTCDDDNEPSRKIIEANGGVLENVVQAPDLARPKRRYWIALDGSSVTQV
jgi:predicted acetyltransferase